MFNSITEVDTSTLRRFKLVFLNGIVLSVLFSLSEAGTVASDGSADANPMHFFGRAMKDFDKADGLKSFEYAKETLDGIRLGCRGDVEGRKKNVRSLFVEDVDGERSLTKLTPTVARFLNVSNMEEKKQILLREFPATCLRQIFGRGNCPLGSKGPRGNPGSIGRPGPSGLPGSPGFNGQDGTPGFDGPSGPPGPSGPRGDDGDQGLQGPQGPQGTPGNNGIDNSQTGSPGLPGLNGPDGTPGLNGNPGHDGQNGPDGDIGNPGNNGANGPNGVDGTPGSDGSPGLDGIPGTVGNAPCPGPIILTPVDEDITIDGPPIPSDN